MNKALIDRAKAISKVVHTPVLLIKSNLINGVYFIIEHKKQNLQDRLACNYFKVKDITDICSQSNPIDNDLLNATIDNKDIEEIEFINSNNIEWIVYK